MNSVGIDVSKGKSTITVNRMGEEIIPPFDVDHTISELSELAKLLKSLDGETRVVMAATGNYYLPIAAMIYNAGIFVCVVNPILLRGYGSSLRPGKTDRADARRLARYGLEHWTELLPYAPQENTWALLKTCSRQYQQCAKIQTMLKNSLIALLDMTFPGVNQIFTSPQRADGSEKWVDFADSFWHRECVSGLSEKTFTDKYHMWCKKHGYNFCIAKACQIYACASAAVSVLPKTEHTKFLLKHAAAQLKSTSASLAALRNEMQSLASALPEYFVVMEKFGVGPALGPQLIVEIGDVRRFKSKKSPVAFAGIDAPPHQSGLFNMRSRHISKRGSPALRRTLFLIMTTIPARSPSDEPVYQFMIKKRSAGKPYKVCMMASANKFLRIYYASVNAFLNSLQA